MSDATGVAEAAACKSAGGRPFAPHALRHRYASMLSMAGVPTRIIQEVLGHSKGSITLDTYSHVLLVGEPPERLRALRRSTEEWAVLGSNQ